MIPDKIYVGAGTLSSIQPAEEYAFPGWQEKPYSQIRNEEYIRKDALIEWVKEHKCVIETHGDERDAYLRGEYSILNSLIDKLNSM